MGRVRARWVVGAVVSASMVGAFSGGCAEAGDGNVGGGATTLATNSASSGSSAQSSGSSSPASSGTSSGGGSASSSAASSGSGSSGVAPGAKLIINEIDGKGGNWVELKNPGTSSVDIGGYGLCDDVDPTMGHVCDMSNIAIFPAGTSVPSGGYVVVVGGEADDAGIGPHLACVDGGPTSCFYASWKISASDGEMIHLLDGSQAVVDEELYPKNAVPSGQTWGRLPDGTGSFAANAPTPGSANQAAP